MSTSNGRAVPPSASTSFAAPASPSTPRASRATLSPRAPYRRATARPTPPVAPVTTITCCVMAYSIPVGTGGQTSGSVPAEERQHVPEEDVQHREPRDDQRGGRLVEHHVDGEEHRAQHREQQARQAQGGQPRPHLDHLRLAALA